MRNHIDSDGLIRVCYAQQGIIFTVYIQAGMREIFNEREDEYSSREERDSQAERNVIVNKREDSVSQAKSIEMFKQEREKRIQEGRIRAR